MGWGLDWGGVGSEGSPQPSSPPVIPRASGPVYGKFMLLSWIFELKSSVVFFVLPRCFGNRLR